MKSTLLLVIILITNDFKTFGQQYTPSPVVPQPGGNYPGPGPGPGPQPQPGGYTPQPQPGGYTLQPAIPSGNYPSQQPGGNYPGGLPQPQPQPQPAYTSQPGFGQQNYGLQPPPAYGTGQQPGGYPGVGGYGNGNQPGGCTSCQLQGGQPGGGYGSGSGSGGDTSDPCFTKYTNCIIVNAQPYERRPSFSLDRCKALCQASRNNASATYQCKSIVYDNANNICDLFAHTGNQPPARLVQYSGRDYFEATGAPGASCGGGTTTGGPATNACPPGQDARFFKIPGTQFTGGGTGVTVNGVTEDQCINDCASNQGQGGAPAPCKAFNYNTGAQTCQLLPTPAPPGSTSTSLTSNAGSNYYEEVCLDSNLVANCPRVLDRLPQKVLVGLAEVVSDSPSFNDCLMKCLNSQQLYNINCVSGEFYTTDNNQQNCILNIMTRKTRPDLFTDETRDKVDYFEPGCTGSGTGPVIANGTGGRLSVIRGGGARVKGVSSLISKIEEENKLEAADSNLEDLKFKDHLKLGEWTQWSPCDRRTDGRRVRYRRCSKPTLKLCPFEAERCQQEQGKPFPSPPRFAFLRDEDSSVTDSTYIGTTNCALNECCPALGGCRIGLLRSSTDGKVQWCTDPCKKSKKKK